MNIQENKDISASNLVVLMLQHKLKNHEYLRYMRSTWENEGLLRTYLNMCKNDVAKCIKKLETMVQSRGELFIETMRDRNPKSPLNLSILNSYLVTPIPPNTIIVRVAKLDVEKYNILHAIRIGMLYYDYLIREESSFFDTTITGQRATIILDMANIKTGHFIRALQALRAIRKIVRLNQEGSLGMTPDIHIINTSFSLEFIMCIVRTFVHSRNMERIHTHRHNLDQVDGGTNYDEIAAEYVDKLMQPSYQQFFIRTEQEQRQMMQILNINK